MKTIKVGFNRTNTWRPADWIIRKFLNIDYSHTYIVTSENKVWQATFSGVHRVSYEYMLEKHDVVLEVEIEIDDCRWIEILSFLRSVENSKYSFWAIIKIGLGVSKWKDYGSKAFVCSELVAKALKEELNITTDRLDVYTPRDVYERVQEYISSGPVNYGGSCGSNP